ncbi:MAG: class II D-tagatose-bisphosphate aldolase, non-catalytic subunit [Candidatus Gastranaerophilales bacterium]|nr:class II D-tagatose-bisphosphate aldolase, non-catalytic subunit [Candidatus Gastranaerophilales bacterium]
MLINKIKNIINSKKSLLCAGPMSLNIVNAVIEIADGGDIPLMLISSRRQIDDKSIKRGYVNNWSTEEFAAYVNKTQKKNNIILARDHGGLWQNNIEIEKKLSLKDAMKSAKDSYACDIDSGFHILHIDPSIDIYNQLSSDIIFERFIELHEFCTSYAKKQNKTIEYEIGTEEQMIHINKQEEFNSTLSRIKKYCDANNYKYPLFVVAQVGTKVVEMKNIGIINSLYKSNNLSDIVSLCSSCKMNNMFIKVHNADYLQDNILKLFPEIGINAVNAAPEFGVCETKAFLELLEKYNLLNIENEFLELAYNSKKWEKWLVTGSRLNKRDKAIIAGHYIFSNPDFIKIKDFAQKHLIHQGIVIDDYLKDKVKDEIYRYMQDFRLFQDIKTEVKAC